MYELLSSNEAGKIKFIAGFPICANVTNPTTRDNNVSVCQIKFIFAELCEKHK